MQKKTKDNFVIDIESATKSMYSSALTKDHPIYSGIPCEPNEVFYYETIQVNVNESGMYTVVSSSSNIIVSSYIYEYDFYPLIPFGNLLPHNDNGCNSRPYPLTVRLKNNIRYILLMTTCSQLEKGNFSIQIFGRSNVSFERVSK